MTTCQKITDERSCFAIMIDYLLENGYSNETLRSSLEKKDSVSIERYLSINNAPFLIVYQLFGEDNLDISIVFETFKKREDEVCSLFVKCFKGNCESYSRNIKTRQFTKLRNLPPYKSKRTISVESNILGSNQFENVFFEAHSFLRDIDGLHPDEALDELCKLIYTKLFDEETSTNLFLVEHGNIEEFAASIRALYTSANEYDVRVYSLKIPGYKRSRGVFSEPIILSANALYKACSIFSKFNFSLSDIDFKARAFQNAYKPAMRSCMGQYFTPIQVIRLMVECIAPSSTELIIDPFAGSAHFLSESLDYVKSKVDNNKEINEFIFYKLHGIEKSERMVRIAMTDMRLHGDGHSNIRCTDALLPFDSYADLLPESFDVVMTNPPFGSVLQKESYSYLGKFDMSTDKAKVPLEILGLERSIQLLRNEGRIAIVLPESVLVNKSFQYVRSWLEDNVTIRGIISLPSTTFAPFGANIKTSVLIATKRKTKENYNIFTSVVENIGFDAKGDDKSDADWPIVAKKFSEFITKEGW